MADQNHEHDHDHDHAPPADEGGALSYHQKLEMAVRELLIEKGVVGADEVRAAVEPGGWLIWEPFADGLR